MAEYETYEFDKFTFGEEYPDRPEVKFGSGDSFASRPVGPDQVIYTLEYQGMLFFQKKNGRLDLERNKRINMGRMVDFYERHRTYGKFHFIHPWKGKKLVRFKDPLVYKLKPDGRGITEPFTVKLILQPQ
jgi:hypothetical protein